MVDAKLLGCRPRYVRYYNEKLSFYDKKYGAFNMFFNSKDINKQQQIKQDFINEQQVIALYGIVQMITCRYLVAVTGASLIGQILQKKIYKVQRIQFYPIIKGGQPGAINKQDEQYCNMLKQFFSWNHIYFSFHYDLTRSLQHFVQNGVAMDNKDSPFFWNQCFVNDMIKIGAFQFICGFISGFISINFLFVNGKNLQLILISRRDKRRQGMRFISRGADLDGNCTNTAQTQQILYVHSNKTIYSYVQTRGSMPFKWGQSPDLKWSPKAVVFKDMEENVKLCQKHFQDQFKLFPKLLLINLIDQKGSKTQKMLGQTFNTVVKNTKKDVRLVWYDFHHQCKNMKYQNLCKLLDTIDKQLQQYRFFVMKMDGLQMKNIQSRQQGSIRTNCMDCLDRTNVAQSVIARYILHKFLAHSDLSCKNKIKGAFCRLPDQMEQTFRNVWSNNADIMSVLYSGTPALKTDFTRTGKRTYKGMIDDGINSLKRYYLGNFIDHNKQNVLDFSLNKINAKTFKAPKQSPLFSLIIIFIIIFSMGCLSQYASQSTLNYLEYKPNQNTWAKTILDPLLLVVSAFVSLKIIQKCKSFFVKKPFMKQQ